MVGSLSLTNQQQWDCVRLRGSAVSKRQAAIDAEGGRVFDALRDELRSTRRTSTFTDADALAAGNRRFNLWLCSQMTEGSSTEIAARFEQMTGTEITRDIAKRQLEIVRNVLASKRIAAPSRKGARMR